MKRPSCGKSIVEEVSISSPEMLTEAYDYRAGTHVRKEPVLA